jgi:hypothetical protein
MSETEPSHVSLDVAKLAFLAPSIRPVCDGRQCKKRRSGRTGTTLVPPIPADPPTCALPQRRVKQVSIRCPEWWRPYRDMPNALYPL